MYNLFRLGGDFLHMLSILILIYKIHAQKSCAGISLKTQILYAVMNELSRSVYRGTYTTAYRICISLKTQILYAVVYVARYTDLLNSYISLYNSGMKLVFICSSVRAAARARSAPARPSGVIALAIIRRCGGDNRAAPARKVGPGH